MINTFRKLIWDISSRTIPFKGKERIIALISRPRDLNQVKLNRDGVLWQLQGHDLNEFYIAIRKNHSPLLLEALINEIASNNYKVFWDIGANIGAVSLPILKHFDHLTAVLFEPSAEVAGRLIRNLSNNPDLAQRATLMNIALAEFDGIQNFYASSETFNSGTAGLGISHNRFQTAVCVQTYTGDSLIKSGKCPIPDIIKIDVEGFEIEVLRGLKQTLLQHHPSILFEHAIYRLDERKRAHDEVTSFLESLGYSIHRLIDNGRIAPGDLDHDADFIARQARKVLDSAAL